MLVLQKYGPVQACLTGAAIFFVVTLIAAGSYMVRKRQIEARVEQAARTAKSTAQTVLADPMLVAAGIQVIRAIGVKKLIPILAVGGLALGFLASRANTSGRQRSAGGVAGAPPAKAGYRSAPRPIRVIAKHFWSRSPVDGWSEAIPINAGARDDGIRFALPILRRYDFAISRR